ncbi:hypothetical protein [Kitasatospora aureofaciens]|uniref:glycan biosynthesis hexose transferase WsfD n=1 Tax=Kitasatospora aureofaciens TaxID=1894 RepID=UPI001C490D78|nr:hypothetical protein [Kitasatospora aureofaciens]MBV6696111.1 hypothetical protein [Kitasatospora aureofaciens]
MTSLDALDEGSPATPPRPPGRRLAPFVARPGVFAPLTGTLAAALMAVRLFVPGPIGMADNGDAGVRMCALDLIVRVDHGSVPFLKYANFGYAKAAPYICSPDQTYRGSGELLLRPAKPLTRMLGLPGVLDLRALAVLFCLIVGAAFAVFAAALRGSLRARLLVCAALFVVVGDTTFAGYAASPYSELAGLAGLLIATAGATHLGGSPRTRFCGLAVFTAGAVLAVGSKVQSATMAVPFLALLCFTKVPLGRAAGRIASRVLPLLAAAAVVASGLFAMEVSPAEFRVMNPTEMIFVGLLGTSSSPAAAAADLGLPESFAQYAGKSWWADHPPQRDPAWPTVRDRMTYRNIAGFLATHPGVTLRLAAHSMEDFGAAYPSYLGSYPASAGLPPTARESRLAVYGSLLRDVGGGLLVLVLGIGAAGIAWVRRVRDNPRRRAFVATMLCLAGVTAVQFLTATYGEAIEGTKHLVFAIFGAGLVLVMTATAAFCTPAPTARPAGPLPTPREERDTAPERTPAPAN